MTDIEMIALVKTLSGNSEVSDDVIAFYLNSTRKFILSYCNIEKIPEGLEPTLVEITALKVKANTSGAEVKIGEGIKQVASMSDGNQSISYTVGAMAGKTFMSEEDIIASYGNILGRYRRMVVPRDVKVERK